MKLLIPSAAKQKCDAHNCKNDAQFCFAIKGRAGKCYLCADCLSLITSDALSALTPKSPKNAIKRISDKREQDKNTANN